MDVRFTLTAEERTFVGSLLQQAQFQGNLVEVQQWTTLQEAALAAVGPTGPEPLRSGKQVVCPAEVAEFIGLSVERTGYNGTLETLKKLQAVALPVIEKLNRALEPARRRQAREQAKAEAAERKRQEQVAAGAAPQE